MKFDDVTILVERKEYKHRPDYKGNKKGSYIDKGKTVWKYDNGEKPGNERIVTQIADKAMKNEDIFLSRQEIKSFLKTEQSQKIYNSLKKIANKKFGKDENDPVWRAYVYGSFTTISYKRLIKDRKAIRDVL